MCAVDSASLVGFVGFGHDCKYGQVGHLAQEMVMESPGAIATARTFRATMSIRLRPSGRFSALLRRNGRTLHLGTDDTQDEALCALAQCA